MKVCVLGLWHLGTVTAACLAAAGHHVVGLDFDPEVIRSLRSGVMPVNEPGLEDLVRSGVVAGRLEFSADPGASLRDAAVLWVTYDTPVDDSDVADTAYVIERVRRTFPHLPAGCLLLLSAQLPVGTTRALASECRATYPDRDVRFACAPENLRLGTAIEAFADPDRVVIGLETETAAPERERVSALFGPVAARIEWMSMESAEMTKHALNAFLATSVAFINEVAMLCEAVGANARDVARGLKTERRIGPRAYLSPGAAFAGGTLARDLVFLEQLGSRRARTTSLLSGVLASNEAHKLWVRHCLERVAGDVRGRRVAVWGLAYKPGTDTLRRSSAVELCRWLTRQGADVQTHDPVVRQLPTDLATAGVGLHRDPIAAVHGAVVLIVATAWPEYGAVPAAALTGMRPVPQVIDPGRFLERTLGSHSGIAYHTVGQAG